jgi:hypothetical protein
MGKFETFQKRAFFCVFFHFFAESVRSFEKGERKVAVFWEVPVKGTYSYDLLGI